MTATGGRTKRLLVRILERRDLEFARLMHNEDSILLKLTDITHITEGEQERWFEELSLSTSSKRYVLLEKETNEYVGIFRADNIDSENRSACVGLDIVEVKRGRHFATEAYEYFFDYFFNQRGYHRLYLATLEHNYVALSLYKKLGFQTEGIGRDAIFRDGQYRNLVWMSILTNEYKRND